MADTKPDTNYDQGLDLNNLPAPPWTPENLGEELFYKLAEVSGAGDRALKQIGLSLDPRTFGRGRAARIARLEDASPERKAELMAEGEAIQAAIDATLPPPSGTPRHPTAPQLTGSTTTRRSRTF